MTTIKSDKKPLYFIGVDGGGTGCRARIENVQGEVLGYGISGPATTRIGIEEAWNSISRAMTAAMEGAGIGSENHKQIYVGVGLAGVGRQGALAALRAIPNNFAHIDFISDGKAACFGAHSGRDGGIVIAGTGSIGLAYIQDVEIRLGGYGFPVSDEGSGADLGLKSIQYALQAHDGRIEKTQFLTEVMQRFDNNPIRVVSWMDRATATDYATLAPLVFRHADLGDAAARIIVQSAAEQIGKIVRSLFNRGAPRVTLLGGLASPLEPWLAPDIRRQLTPADGDAVSGAIIFARSMLAQT